jgi:hypothetical protein
MKNALRSAGAALAVCAVVALCVAGASAPALAAEAPQSASFDLSAAIAWASAALHATWAVVSTPAAVAGLTGFLMAVLPQGEPGSKWDTARTVLNFVAMNWGNAKNLTLKG